MANSPGVAVTSFAASIVGFTKAGIVFAKLPGGAIRVFVAVVIRVFAYAAGSCDQKAGDHKSANQNVE